MREYKTGPRRLLLALLEQNRDQSLSAEQIAERIAADGGEISLSAIYRNLERLEQEGSVRRAASEGGRKAVYQYIGGECSEHLHLQCTECGQIIHLDHETTEALCTAAQACGDFSIDEKKTVLYGRCRACRA